MKVHFTHAKLLETHLTAYPKPFCFLLPSQLQTIFISQLHVTKSVRSEGISRTFSALIPVADLINKGHGRDILKIYLSAYKCVRVIYDIYGQKTIFNS